jgi:signal recognition particle GTPase
MLARGAGLVGLARAASWVRVERVVAAPVFWEARRGMGFFDSIMGSAEKRQAEARVDAERKASAAIMDYLRRQERFDMSSFETLLKDAKKSAGVDSWRSMFRSAEEQETLEREVGSLVKVVEQLSADEKADPRLIRRPEKVRIARDAGVEITVVNRFLTEFESFGAVHEWIHARVRRGDHVPETTMEAVALMSLPGERTARTQAAAKRTNRVRGRKGLAKQSAAATA